MTINFNLEPGIKFEIGLQLEIELEEISGPITHHEKNGTSTTNFYIGALNRSSGYYSGVFAWFTDNAVEVINYDDEASYARNSIEALIVQQLIGDLLKDAGASINADLGMLWADGFISITSEESDLIKSLITSPTTKKEKEIS